MFERFSPDARRAVVLAQERARSLGHDYIGTEHIVLALLAEGDRNAAAEALADAGITHEAFEREILAIVGRGQGAPSGHIPFTPRSKKVLELSLREALRLKSKSIGTEHILLGLIREGEGLACQILVTLGADLVALRDRIEARTSVPVRRGRRWFRGPDPRVTSATPGGARVAERALDRAAGQPVASHHYLLGLLDDDDSLGAKVLGALGVTRQAVEAKLTELGPEGTSDEPPERAAARRTSLGVEGDAISIRIADPDLAARLREQLAGNQTEILRGLDVPGSDRLWQAVLPAVQEAVEKLEASRAATATDWTPPGWSQEGVAAYAVASTGEGTRTRLWVAEGVDEDEVRRWLADWLASKAPDTDECATFTVAVDRVGGDLTVVSWGFGRRSEVPVVPFTDLVTAAIRDLERAA